MAMEKRVCVLLTALLASDGAVATSSVWQHAAPGAPHNVTVTVSTRSARLQWSHAPPSEGGLAAGFAVQWCSRAWCSRAQDAAWSANLQAQAPSFELGELKSGQTYAFRISAYNGQATRVPVPL